MSLTETELDPTIELPSQVACPQDSSHYRMFIHHCSRIMLFNAVYEGKPTQQVEDFYLRHTSALVPTHDYPDLVDNVLFQVYTDHNGRPPVYPLTRVEKEMFAQAIEFPPKEVFLRSRALEIFNLDLQVARNYRKKGRSDLADLIEKEQEKEAFFWEFIKDKGPRPI